MTDRFPNHQFDELSPGDIQYVNRNKQWEDYENWVEIWRAEYDIKMMDWTHQRRFTPHQIVIMYLVYFILNEAE